MPSKEMSAPAPGWGVMGAGVESGPSMIVTLTMLTPAYHRNNGYLIPVREKVGRWHKSTVDRETAGICEGGNLGDGFDERIAQGGDCRTLIEFDDGVGCPRGIALGAEKKDGYFHWGKFSKGWGRRWGCVDRTSDRA